MKREIKSKNGIKELKPFERDIETAKQSVCVLDRQKEREIKRT